MFHHVLTRARATGAAVAALSLVTACSYTDTPSAPMRAPGAALNLALDVSSTSEAPGRQVAIAIDADYIGTLGGVQGYFRFDPTRLRYVGQSTTDGDILLINANEAARGTLRLGAMNSAGLGDEIGTMVFEVLRPGYATGLDLDVTEASTTGGPVSIIDDVRVANFNGVASSALRVPAEAKRMSVVDWLQKLQPGADPKAVTFNTPGQNVTGLLYGDANLTQIGGVGPFITLSDALYVLNVSVGLNELITGTDAPARDAVIAGNVVPANVGTGLQPGFVSADDHGELTLSDALAILNESVGIAQPVVGDQIRPAPATNRVVVSANITTNTTWTKNNVYELQGGVQVTGGATLTIEPGTQIEGQRGTGPGVGGAALFVQRDGRIVADGTPAEPIVFTCVGTPTARFKGCWGGLVINGNATLNEGTPTSPAISGRATAGCNELVGEGTSGLYGGCNPDDNSGILRYVRVEYAGFRFTPTNELNGLALQGVGRGTIVDYVQIHGGLDDGLEYFGGTVNARHLVLTANSDDSMDWVSGWSGSVQFVIIQQDSLDADKGFEADNSNTLFDALPRAQPTIYNVTFVGKRDPAGTGGPAANNVEDMMHIRRGTRPVISNVLGEGFPFILRCDDTPTASTPFVIQNGRFNTNGANQNASSTCPAPYNAASNPLGTLWTANEFQAATTMYDPYNVLLPDFRPIFGTATGGAIPSGGSDPAFVWDASATYKGAVAPANSSKSNIPWYSGWTRGWTSATAP